MDRRVSRVAVRCRFLILRAGKSENLQRELSMLAELSLVDKLFIVTAPDRHWRILPRSWVTYSERWTWLQFLRLITARGLTGCEYPGRGAVVSFESERAVSSRKVRLRLVSP